MFSLQKLLVLKILKLCINTGFLDKTILSLKIDVQRIIPYFFFIKIVQTVFNRLLSWRTIVFHK